ncbi:alpha/beta hydrolase [Chloroflexus sp.]|uniref:alpha/beta hydrolase n=1 Tax=Chloroflexus sp. TaxID=1904827 RepID=UPI00263954A6|nr:alpha/beta hydrolase [uncultured Chloroflexus sp.]
MALDAATSAFLAEMAKAGGKQIHEMTPAEARALGATLSSMYGPAPDVARVEDHTIATPDGGSIRIRILFPEGTPRAMMIYYHGGGWVIGALEEFDNLGRRLATRTGCAVALVDYRLAPEHRYPTAADDAYLALEWVDNYLKSNNLSMPIIVAGDSAGGNLTAVVARRARDRHGPSIAMQILVYPVTDASFDRPSYLAPENQLLLTREGMIWFWDHYVPDPARREEPDASPLRADDLSGLPPAVVILAEHDVLLDEGEAYAQRLMAAGVSVESKCYEGQMHGFFTLLMLPRSNDAIEQIANAIEAHLTPQSA